MSVSVDTSRVYTSPGTYDSVALITGRISAKSWGSVTLLGFVAFNNNAATRYIQVFDSATAPAANAVPIAMLMVPAGSEESFAFPIKILNGLTIVTSTTPSTYTAGSTDMFLCPVFWQVN